ncbi:MULTISPECIES: CpsB/CapC family capsule biosynthesis tyrosine phosphatase [unclassified Leeuwenhoekiella]|uniref:tyrosine-protein phosphatase n=1 Tax=unclassified Leeuwenhoekiella TaxID=2615029 RepID=UPI000C63D77E|nr:MULTISPECIES: CpsB/CapC family capsule biosynthesis tyrosine phosphatase [unclassified Leeuwenhoekiella]MAW94048.1 histidinol phosphatase [Leeuwenhoekiella sp.]MBA80913.1 histidinol phosphatase [Leeuwenhoekiella sp.]|tara:strand:- start:36693 stop:37430 length:738 start_codon:yes stop_codon:yes gene_type:complete
MFSIFSSKKLLASRLGEFTDIHNHILPGIDDGAKTPEDSLQLLSHFKELGITNLICTPHTMSDFHPNTPETITDAKKRLQEFLAEKSHNEFQIRASSEYMMDSAFTDLLEAKIILPLKDQFVLVEMSYLQPPVNLREILFKIGNAGFIPVLAHPERYAFYHSKYSTYTELKSICKFQLNALSITGYYGPGIAKTALKLLEDGMFDFLGTDTHHMRHIENLKKAKYSGKHEQALDRIINNTTATFS